jgi:hypothetical protein
LLCVVISGRVPDPCQKARRAPARPRQPPAPSARWHRGRWRPLPAALREGGGRAGREGVPGVPQVVEAAAPALTRSAGGRAVARRHGCRLPPDHPGGDPAARRPGGRPRPGPSDRRRPSSPGRRREPAARRPDTRPAGTMSR